ncbi:hypothetical protein [Chamaesiphon minutus]|uniref:Uncharacterized protein n=1 Tax=Chamaesiphon minutus (strain ATCC 27169 / PCC 6605) TaxID=1173020 RepID=K9U949_CHAP6|nr:hypothetical protein [Chamaesiphon minutus]AFY91330.1 hypothetical protein Cha6605_0022 [Chamaesiphon minutus PCC 6605]
MKTKFLLMFLALSGLCWSANSASVTTIAPITDRQNANLSQTMAELIGFDRDTYSLVEMAIDRALIAQQVNEVPLPQIRTAGVPVATPPDARQNDKKPLIGGKWAPPTERKIGQIKNQKTTPDRSHPAGGIKVKQNNRH